VKCASRHPCSIKRYLQLATGATMAGQVRICMFRRQATDDT
jgi:hypothetical protein